MLTTLITVVLLYLHVAFAWLSATETTADIHVASDRLNFTISKVNGDLYNAFFDGVGLLGRRTSTTGRGYLVCYCTGADILSSSGEFFVGSNKTTTYTLIDSADDRGTHYIGIYLEDKQPTGQTFQYWFFVRDDGTNAIHQWTRLTYENETVPFLTEFGEYRYLFRPPGAPQGIWTHLSTNEHTEAPVPSASDLASEIAVQDATWVFPNSTSEYSEAVGSYFTKYIFADKFDYTHKAHGIYADGSTTNGTTLGVWQLLNTRDTYYGGPDRYDLLVDGAVYNKWSTSHYGARQSNITTGFDRTFGPQALYFNGGGTLAELRNDAYSKATEAWQQQFYDFLGRTHVPTYVQSSQRGKLVGQITVPHTTVRAQAVLAQNGVDYAWNVGDQSAHQHWADVDLKTGRFEIDRVAQGTYRLTIKLNGVFGDYYEDDVVVHAGKTTTRSGIRFNGETHGEELWRIGIPDRTAGEYKHGFELDEEHTSHFEQYRQVWQAYDFPSEFPSGVNFTIGASSEATDWNYIHWSVYGPSYTRPKIATGVNNFTIHFHLDAAPAAGDNFTLTIALAGAKGSSIPASFDSNNIAVDWTLADVELWTLVNDHSDGAFRWDIWTGFQSSLGVRSGISGFNLVTYWSWGGGLLRQGWNKIVLSLPEDVNAVSYVMYDALRLEVARAKNTLAG